MIVIKNTIFWDSSPLKTWLAPCFVLGICMAKSSSMKRQEANPTGTSLDFEWLQIVMFQTP
jgi:hypothetical protein